MSLVPNFEIKFRKNC